MTSYLGPDIFINSSPEDLFQKLWHLSHLILDILTLTLIYVSPCLAVTIQVELPIQLAEGWRPWHLSWFWSVLIWMMIQNSFFVNLMNFLILTSWTLDMKHSRVLLVTTCDKLEIFLEFNISYHKCQGWRNYWILDFLLCLGNEREMTLSPGPPEIYKKF